MGMTRKKKTSQLPKYVYLSKGRYVYKPYLGRQDGKTKFGKEIVLCRGDSLITDIWAAYERVVKMNNGTLRWMLQQYHASDKYKSLKKTTRTGYEIYFATIASFPTSSGTPWGDTPIAATTPKAVRKYLDKREHKTGGNREIQYLKAAFSWAYQRLDEVTSNPCKGVDLNDETPRDRYVEHWEYAVMHEIAKDSRAKYIAPAMEMAYLSRARRHEVCAYKKADILDEGLFLSRGKGSKNEITLWTARLSAAVKACQPLYDHVSSMYLIHGKDGQPARRNAWDSLWQRLRKKAMKVGAIIGEDFMEEAKKSGAVIKNGRVILGEEFNFHDLKAKGISDHKFKHGGHKSAKMKAVYDRLPEKIEATK